MRPDVQLTLGRRLTEYNVLMSWRVFWNGVREFLHLLYNEPPGS